MSYSSLHCPDVTIMDVGGYGVHTLVELTVCRATAASNVRPAARMGLGGTMVRTPADESLAARQEARRAGYGEVGPRRLLVFAVGEYNMLSRDAEKLLNPKQLGMFLSSVKCRIAGAGWPHCPDQPRIARLWFSVRRRVAGTGRQAHCPHDHLRPTQTNSGQRVILVARLIAILQNHVI
jgi:hypothetical protein